MVLPVFYRVLVLPLVLSLVLLLLALWLVFLGHILDKSLVVILGKEFKRGFNYEVKQDMTQLVRFNLKL